MQSLSGPLDAGLKKRLCPEKELTLKATYGSKTQLQTTLLFSVHPDNHFLIKKYLNYNLLDVAMMILYQNK